MLWSIDRIKSLKIDGQEYQVYPLFGQTKFPEYPCPKCRETLYNHCLFDIHQMGFERDCNIVVVHCMMCDHRYAVRFYLTVDEVAT